MFKMFKFWTAVSIICHLGFYLRGCVPLLNLSSDVLLSETVNGKDTELCKVFVVVVVVVAKGSLW